METSVFLIIKSLRQLTPRRVVEFSCRSHDPLYELDSDILRYRIPMPRRLLLDMFTIEAVQEEALLVFVDYDVLERHPIRDLLLTFTVVSLLWVTLRESDHEIPSYCWVIIAFYTQALLVYAFHLRCVRQKISFWLFVCRIEKRIWISTIDIVKITGLVRHFAESDACVPLITVLFDVELEGADRGVFDAFRVPIVGSDCSGDLKSFWTSKSLIVWEIVLVKGVYVIKVGRTDKLLEVERRVGN